jgi:hypothetical protein
MVQIWQNTSVWLVRDLLRAKEVQFFRVIDVGATYLSIQAETTDRNAVLTVSREFAEKHSAEFQCYVGEPLGLWTAIYPSFSPVMDPFARELSKAIGSLVLSLVSAAEDEIFCNFCLAGKDLGFVKISTGKKRSPKQQEPIAKKLSLLKAHLSAESQRELVVYLSDTRNILWGSDILRTFCQAAGIRNAMTSYDYIQRNEYAADLDTPVQLVKIG